jgi:hypothetical protein
VVTEVREVKPNKKAKQMSIRMLQAMEAKEKKARIRCPAGGLISRTIPPTWNANAATNPNMK